MGPPADEPRSEADRWGRGRPRAWVTADRVGRLVKFGVVGSSGVLVNLGVFRVVFALLDARLAATHPIDIRFTIANASGIAVSILTNFLLNDRWTWGDRRKGNGRDWARRLAKYYVGASVAAGIQLLIASAARIVVFAGAWVTLPAMESLQTHRIDLGPTLAVLSGIAVGMAVNFLISHHWAFRDAEVNR